MLKKQYIFLDFSGTLVKMRPARLLLSKNKLGLLSKNYLLGIITGAKRKETINILRKLKIQKRFSIIVTKDDSVFKKPDAKLFPNEPTLAYVGDTKKDELLAKNAGVSFFRVSKKCNINRIIKKLLI